MNLISFSRSIDSKDLIQSNLIRFESNVRLEE